MFTKLLSYVIDIIDQKFNQLLNADYWIFLSLDSRTP